MSTQTLNATLVQIISAIWPFVLAGAMIITLIAIIMTGFEIIVHRKDSDKRKEALKSLIFVALGTLIVVGSLFITKVILGMADDVAGNLQSGQVSSSTSASDLLE